MTGSTIPPARARRATPTAALALAAGLLAAGITVAAGFASCGPAPKTALVNRKLARADVDARVYKTAGSRDIELHIFYPEGYSPTATDPYPVALSFHGGGWNEGPIEWGYGDAQYLAGLGYVGIAVGYRLALSDGATAYDSMKDAASAVRWVRTYAADLNADPNRVLAVGHSAGGHLALCVAMLPDASEAGEDKSVSSVPNAVIALAPAVDVGRDEYFGDRLLGVVSKVKCSPIDNVHDVGIPILVVHGAKDPVLPIATARRFVEAMRASGNDIELVEYPLGTHSFFYDGAEGQDFARAAIRKFILE